jgi:hypothetical protein
MRAAPENRGPAPLANGCRADENDQAGYRIDYQGNSAAEEQQGALRPLASLHRSWGPPEDNLIWWLLGQGVPEPSMISPWCIGGGRVSFNGQQFELDPDSEPAITFRAEDCEEVIDLTAWQPRTGKLASWRAQAFCIGDFDDLFNPAIYFAGGALRIHASPLEWLRANREGIVVLRPDLAYAHLRYVRRLSFADPTHARRVQSWMRAPQVRAEFFIETSAEMVK